MKNLYIYGHGGSQNHGNEAIVRGVAEIFPNRNIILFSNSPEVDIQNGLDSICQVRSAIEQHGFLSFKRIVSFILDKLYSGKEKWIRWHFSPLLRNIETDAIYLLEAGDQYCETSGKHIQIYSCINKILTSCGAKTVMLGCTINKDILEKQEVIDDLKHYSLIIARETITYSALCEHGLNNVILRPDPAFAMKAEKCFLPEIFYGKNVVGINIGFLAQGNEKYTESLIQCMQGVVDRILKYTDCVIALIPHVNWGENLADHNMLKQLLQQDNDRIFEIAEHNAPQTKYILSKCSVFIALRTHAAIAALSVMTPTVLTGYKTKTLGICKDIFNSDYEKYYCDLTSLNEDMLYSKVFTLLSDAEVKTTFKAYTERYLSSVYDLKNEIEKIDRINQK